MNSFENLIATNDQASLFLERYLTQLSKEEFKNCIYKIQYLISVLLEREPEITNEVMEAIELLNVFNKANMKREQREQVDYSIFYNDEINKLENL